MAFGKTFVLFSPFSGTAVTDDGAPAAGIKIERSWKWGWNNETGSDHATTDNQGRFSFPVIEGHSFTASFMPHEPHITQSLIASMASGEVEIWHAIKKSYDLNSELNGKPTRVVCRLDKEPSDEGLYWGTCVED